MWPWSKKKTPASPAPAPATAHAPVSVRGRRGFESAQTDRLNDTHWANAKGQTINAQLRGDLATISARAQDEANQNGPVEGVITTHQETIVGVHGPALQVQSSSKPYNEGLEKLWSDWWESPDIAEQLSGVEMLELWIWSLWTTGAYIVQITNDPEASGPIKLRLMNILSSRLATPWDKSGSKDTIMGVERNKQGKPLKYWFRDADINESSILKTDFEEVPAEFVVHGYRTRQAGQARGVPWLQSSLSSIAEMRDYDNQVVDAARAAADHALYMQATGPDVDWSEQEGVVDVERRTISTLPPGYELAEVKGSQPLANYVEFRMEKQRDLGLPAGMPLMVVRKDSSKHNYSSARLDTQMWRASIDKMRDRFETKALKRFVTLLAIEGRVANILPPRPDDVKLIWTWPGQPHVDPLKEAKADTESMANGTLSYTDALARQGKDLEITIAQRKREQTLLEEAGLPPLPRAEDRNFDDDDDDKIVPDNNSNDSGNGRMIDALHLGGGN